MKKFLLLLISLILIVVMLVPSVFAAQGNKVTIWSWREVDNEVWNQVENELKKQGVDIEIEHSVFRPEEYSPKILLSLQGGEGADLVYSRRLPGGDTENLIKSSLYLPLDEKIDLSNFPQVALNAATYNGKVYGVPFAVQVLGIFYNKDIYAKYDLSEPKTWDELVSNAEVLKKNGITPFFIPGKVAWFLALQHGMCGVSILGPEWIKNLIEGKTNFLDPKYVDLNRKINDLKKYYQDSFMANDMADQDAALAFGQTAMILTGIWGLPTWKELDPDVNVGYFMVPPARADQKPYAYTYNDGSITMTSSVKNKELANKVLEFVATPKFGTIFSNVTFNIPAVSGAEVPDDPLLREVVDIYNNHASPYLYVVGSVFDTQTPSLYNDVLSPGMQAMYLDEITPEELAKMSQDEISKWYEPLMKK